MSRKADLKVLQKGIKKRGNPLGVTLLHFLQLDWPDSDVVLTRLRALLDSSGISADEAAVLTCTITEHSLKAYGATLFSERNKKNQDPYRVAVFINHVINALIDHLISGIGGRSQFTAFVDAEGGLGWGQPEQHTAEDILRLRAYMYESLVKDELKQAMRRSDYEQALLDGAFNTLHSDIGCNDPCAG